MREPSADLALAEVVARLAVLWTHGTSSADAVFAWNLEVPIRAFAGAGSRRRQEESALAFTAQ